MNAPDTMEEALSMHAAYVAEVNAKAAVIAAAMAADKAEIARLREALSPMIDVAHAYAEYISQVPSAELERHPYLPGLEQEIDAARQALETPHAG